MIKLTKQQLARNLDRAIGTEVGLKGLNDLIYAWMKKRKYCRKYYFAVHNRAFLYITEVRDLSEYAGYNLSQ